MYGQVNNLPVTTLCHCGEKGIVVTLPTGGVNITGFTLTVKVSPYVQGTRPASPAESYGSPYVVASGDGMNALWTLQGTEFPPPTGGLFFIELHADSASQSLKSGVVVRVLDAW